MKAPLFYVSLLVLSLGQTAGSFAQSTDPSGAPESVAQRNARMGWWRKARFGMFIHWGVYAVPAGRYHGKLVQGFYDGHVVPSAGEWIMHDAKIPRAEYQAFAKKFNPTHYDPDAWVKMAKAAGMKYIVITSKHHEGFAMFDSKASNWNVVQATPYGKDIIRQLAEACRRQGMKLGLYYSQANDWNNPGGAAAGGHWDSTQNGSMDEYLRKVAVPQIEEILSNYGDVAELWWDVPTDMTPERAALFLPLLKKQPNIITNNRLGGNVKGDIETPEQYIPGTGFPRDWETCMTMNDTWGFKLDDHHWKSSEKLIRNLIDIASKGGNYLLNVGPTADGEFPPPIKLRLQAIGKWMNTNSEAIYGTTASPFRNLSWGRCTRKVDEDGNQVFYLHVFDWPTNGVLHLRGMQADIKKASLLAGGRMLKTKQTATSLDVYVPARAPDTIATVIKLTLNGVPQIQPYAEEASTGGIFRLTAEIADLHNDTAAGEEIQLEGDDKLNIGMWSDPMNWVGWKIRVSKAGAFTVKATMAGPDDSGKMIIAIGDQTLTVPVRKTGGYHHFKEFILGKITIPTPGIYEVTVHPQTAYWKAFNLQGITLIP
jgi:alpha-L-fucosidase